MKRVGRGCMPCPPPPHSKSTSLRKGAGSKKGGIVRVWLSDNGIDFVCCSISIAQRGELLNMKCHDPNSVQFLPLKRGDNKWIEINEVVSICTLCDVVMFWFFQCTVEIISQKAQDTQISPPNLTTQLWRRRLLAQHFEKFHASSYLKESVI